MFGKKSKEEYKRIEPEEEVMENEFDDEDIIPPPLEEEIPERIPPKKAEAKKEIKPVKTAIVKTIVVPELPTQPIRKVRLDDGSVANLITISEALTKIMAELEKED